MLYQYQQKVNPKEASVHDCDQARPNNDYLIALSLRARAFDGYLRSKIAQEFGDEGVKRAEELFKDGSIDEDLDTLSTARVKTELFGSLKFVFSDYPPPTLGWQDCTSWRCRVSGRHLRGVHQGSGGRFGFHKASREDPWGSAKAGV